jgi:DNA replication protein DnaC
MRKLHRVELLILDDLALHPLGTEQTSDFYDYADSAIMPTLGRVPVV